MEHGRIKSERKDINDDGSRYIRAWDLQNSMIEITESPDKTRWSEFVYNHPHGNIFQTPEMAEVYKRTKNYEPITLAAINTRNDEILAILQAVAIKELSGFLGSFSARAIIQGGPLFIENENGIKALKVLMKHYDEIARKKALYTQIRTMWDTSNISSFLNSRGYEYEERLNFLIDLNRPEETIFSDFKRDKKRAIKKAEKMGLYLKIADSGEEINSFCEILSETYKAACLPLADKTLFYSLFNICKEDKAKIFLAKINGELIAGRLILCYKTTIIDWYAGAKRDCLLYRPNEFLVWHGLKWGSENGFHTFNFGGAGNPNEEYGVREFKKQFGGKLVGFGRYTKIYSPIKMKIAEKGFSIYRKGFFNK